MPEETVVAFRGDPDAIAPSKHVRSTLVSSSLNALRKRGLLPKYEVLVPPAYRDALLSCVAGVWLPMEMGIAHYSTCEALGLATSEVYEIGMDVSVQVQASFLATLAKMARSAGVTPWTGLSHFQRLWDRVLDGGGTAVYRVGPKDARVEIVSLPLVDIPYFRVAFRGFIVAGCNIFSTKAYGKDLPSVRGSGRVAYRIAWA
jgi:hypothetical protein